MKARQVTSRDTTLTEILVEDAPGVGFRVRGGGRVARARHGPARGQREVEQQAQVQEDARPQQKLQHTDIFIYYYRTSLRGEQFASLVYLSIRQYKINVKLTFCRAGERVANIFSIIYFQITESLDVSICFDIFGKFLLLILCSLFCLLKRLKYFVSCILLLFSVNVTKIASSIPGFSCFWLHYVYVIFNVLCLKKKSYFK